MIDIETLRSMRHSLEKQAGPNLRALAKNLGRAVAHKAPKAGPKATHLAKSLGRTMTSGAATPGAIGAGVGAVAGGAKAYKDSDGDLQSTVVGGVRGGIVGGAAAATVGGVGRAARDAKLMGYKGNAVVGGVKRLADSAKKQLKSQVHGVTGAYGKNRGAMSLPSKENARSKLKLVGARLKDDVAHARKGGASPDKIKALQSKAFGARNAAVHEGVAGSQALDQGITSLPGVAKGLVKNPKQTAKNLWQKTTGGTAKGAIVPIGLPVAAGAHSLSKGDESATGGLTRTQKLRNTLVDTGAMVATGGLPVAAGLAAFSGADKLRAQGKKKA